MKNVFFVKIPQIMKKNIPILSALDFSFPLSSIIALIGPNGAGKTTLLRALLHPLNYHGLEFRLAHIPLHSLRRKEYSAHVSHLGSSDFSQPSVRLLEFIKSAGYYKSFHEADIQKDLEFWELDLISDQNVSSLSLGQFQRLLLLVTCMQEADIYLFDEPERHLDPRAKKLYIQKIKELKKKGKTVFFSTHDLDLAVSASDYFVGLGSCGVKQFSSDAPTLIRARYLDTLFNTRFHYQDVDGEIRVL